jgi:hypothetical protein
MHKLKKRKKRRSFSLRRRRMLVAQKTHVIPFSGTPNPRSTSTSRGGATETRINNKH